jgi:RHS repeat-associated protein
MKKTVTALLSALFLGCAAFTAFGSPKLYDNWPDTDQEWNKLTNHIMWCYENLRERQFVATGYEYDVGDPCLICPFRDYLWIAAEIDCLAPLFVNQSLAGPDGHFDDWFSSTNNALGRCPDDFPYWTPAALHSNAFGHADWSTNSTLSAWMAVTNRAFVSEVTKAINMLCWGSKPSSWLGESLGGFRHSWSGQSNNQSSFGKALSSVSQNYYDSEQQGESSDDTPYTLGAWNFYGSSTNNTLEADFSYIDDRRVNFCWFDYRMDSYTNSYPNSAVCYPSVVSFVNRSVDVHGYQFPNLAQVRRTFFCEELGQIKRGGVYTITCNRLAETAVFPLTQAALDSGWKTESTLYSELGTERWLVKGKFAEFPASDLPDAPPIETPDTDRDDIVEIFPVKDLPGSETGTFVVSHEDEAPSLYLPLGEPAVWQNKTPVHAYLTQSAVTNLPYHYLSSNGSEATEFGFLNCSNGYSTAFSLNTHIQDFGVVTNDHTHLKQALVVRPRGQAVVFDFPWEGTRFSSKGYPTGINRNLGYVLMDLDECYTNSGSFFWALRFPSGIVHTFYRPVDDSTYNDFLQFHIMLCVINEDVGISQLYGNNDGYYYDDRHMWVKTPTSSTNGTYHVAVDWDKGLPVAAKYYSAVSGELCESVGIQYERGRAVRLSKSDASAGAEITGEGSVGYGTGVKRSRRQDGTRENGRTVVVQTFSSAEDTSPCLTETRAYDSFQRMMSRALTSGQQTLSDVYVYGPAEPEDARYPTTGLLVRNSVLVATAVTPFGSFSEAYSYTPAEGWPATVTRPLGGGHAATISYDYVADADLTNDDGEVAHSCSGPMKTLNLRSATTLMDGDVCRKSLFYCYAFGLGRWVRAAQICNTAGSVFDAPDDYCCWTKMDREIPEERLSPSMNGWAHVSFSSEESLRANSATQMVIQTAIDSAPANRIAFDNWKNYYGCGNTRRATNTLALNARGVPLYRRTQTREGTVLEETVTEVDGRNRPARQRFMDGTSVSYENYCLHGPQRIVNRDGSVTTLAYDPFGRVKTKADGETGITSTYEYDPLGHVTKQTRAGGGRTAESIATYGLDGTLLYSKDENGHEMSVTGQNADNFLVLTRTETGKDPVVETCWGDGVLKSVSGTGAAIRFTRTRGVSGGKLWIKQANPDNEEEWTKDWYSFNGLYAYTERPGGIIDSVSYDKRLSLQSKINGDGVRSVFDHDAGLFNPPSLSGTSLAGGQTLDLASDPFCVSNAYAFTPQGLKTTVYSYPEDGSPEPFEEGSRQDLPDGRAGTFVQEGREGSYTNSAPPSTGTYVQTVAFPGGKTVTRTYEKFLLRKTVTRDSGSPRTVTAAYGYDGFGELVSFSTDAKGFKETFTVGRDAKGLVGSVNSTARGTTALSRNGASQITRISGPSGQTTLGWLANGMLSGFQDDAGPVYTLGNDALGRNVSVACTNDTLSSAVGFTYGNDGGFAAKTRDGVQTLACPSRRADGRPAAAVLPGGVTVACGYDGAGRQVSQTWADPEDPSANVTFTNSWMRDGRLRARGQAGGPQVSNAVFRAGGRVQSEKTFFTLPDGARASVLAAFDAATGKPSATEPRFDGVAAAAFGATAQHDALGHVGLISCAAVRAAFACADGGAVTNTSLAVGGNGLLDRSVTWSASAGKPARVNYTLGGQFLRRWDYAFTNGLVSRVARHGGDGVRTVYAFDAQGRLSSAASCVADGRPFPYLSFAYAYSPSGDTVQFGRAGRETIASASGDLHVMRMSMPPYAPVLGRVSAPGAAVDASIGENWGGATVVGSLFSSNLGSPFANFYTGTSGTETVTATLPNGTSDTARVSVSFPAFLEYPAYNARGMTLSDSRRAFRWDAAGRLLSVTNSGVSPAAALSFEYYPDGRRASKTVSRLVDGAWSVSRSIHYAWDGWKLAAECERDGAGTVTAVRSFVWGPDIEGQKTGSLESGAEGIGGLLAVIVASNDTSRIYLPLTDGLGNVCGLIDSEDGSLAAEYDYDPYGGVVIERGPAAGACPFRHRTRYYDRETWLYYYGHRYYDPSTTKWISKDPQGESGGWNLTAFCANDPINNYDALGLWSWSGFGEGLWDFASEPFKAVSDAFVLTPMLAVNNFLSGTDIALEDARFGSMLAGGTSARRLAGESGLGAAGRGYADLGLAVGTLGLYPMGKNIGDSWALYSTGDITFDELDYRLSRGAGGATAAALAGSAASRFAGRGWTGRALRPTKQSSQPFSDNGENFLYRVVEKDSVHDIEASLQRTMTPRGGSATPEEVIRGINLASEYFPWTRNLDFAQRYGRSMYGIGKFNIYRVKLTPQMQSVPAKNILPWNDPLLSEEEVLLKGVVHDIELLSGGR